MCESCGMVPKAARECSYNIWFFIGSVSGDEVFRGGARVEWERGSG